MFKVGDLIRLKRGYEKDLKAEAGATAIVTEINVIVSVSGWFGSPNIEYIRLDWVRDEKDHNQSNGFYIPDRFTKI